MPRIRKETSKRGTTNRRSQIKKKVAESRKKAKKAAKKNVAWKTKTPKDPGIPNNFPYKDQILAEVAEQRRQAAEEKQSKKDAKKANKAQKSKPGEEGEDGGEGSADEGDATGFDGIVTLGPSHLKKAEKDKVDIAEVEDEADDVPILINPDLPTLQSVLDRADVVVEVLDARDPLAYRSARLEALVAAKPGQKLLFVLNKIDACAREPVSSWLSQLRASNPTVLFRSASSLIPSKSLVPDKKGKGKDAVNDAWGADSVLELLKQWAEEKPGSDPLEVAVIGLTNVGKSSFINSLLRKNILPVYTTATSSRGPTTTTHAQEVTLDSIRLIDTPGLSWDYSGVDTERSDEADELRVQDILLRNKGRVDRLKDPVPAVSHIVSRATTEDLMLFYNLPAFAKGDASAFLAGVARANGFVKRGGVLDLEGAARLVLRDWSTGKLPRYAAPPPADTAARVSALSDEDTAVLEKLALRKEARRAAGLVKLVAGKVDERPIALTAPWMADSRSESEAEGEDDEDVEMEDQDGEEDGDDEDEEDEEEDEPAPSPLASKRKRPASKSAAPASPAKKVAFAAPTRPAKAKAPAPPAPALASKKSALKPHKPVAVKKSRPAASAPGANKKAAAAAKGDEYDFAKFF